MAAHRAGASRRTGLSPSGDRWAGLGERSKAVSEALRTGKGMGRDLNARLHGLPHGDWKFYRVLVDSGPSATAMQWQECANTGHSPVPHGTSAGLPIPSPLWLR
jgi:hypothetical protein